MAKYNHGNPKHRLWLANNLLTILSKWGFTIDAETERDDVGEFVLSKPRKFKGGKIVIYTAINKSNGLCRAMGDDRIRIVVHAESGFGTKVCQINRTGEFSSVTSRVVDGILKAQKV